MEPSEDQANDTETPTMKDRVRARLSLPVSIDLDIFYSIAVCNYGPVTMQGDVNDVMKIGDLSMEFADLKKSWDSECPRIYFTHNGVAFEIVAA